jgi:hypothetical protein
MSAVLLYSGNGTFDEMRLSYDPAVASVELYFSEQGRQHQGQVIQHRFAINS